MREGDKFVRMVENQKSWQKLNTELEVKVGPLWDILTLTWTTGINYYDSKGHDYRHNYTNWYNKGRAIANYKNWTAMFMFQGHVNNFFGETMSTDENFHALMVSYRHKRCTFGLGSLNPFVNNWSLSNRNYSAFTPSKNSMHIKESSRLFAVSFAYNFSFGRKYDSGSKRLNNQDSDSGVMSGGK